MLDPRIAFEIRARKRVIDFNLHSRAARKKLITKVKKSKPSFYVTDQKDEPTKTYYLRG